MKNVTKLLTATAQEWFNSELFAVDYDKATKLFYLGMRINPTTFRRFRKLGGSKSTVKELKAEICRKS